VQFLDFSNDSTFINNPKLFADVGHLNDGGARIFSNELIDKINSLNGGLLAKDLKNR
jgi:hypothetical protein